MEMKWEDLEVGDELEITEEMKSNNLFRYFEKLIIRDAVKRGTYIRIGFINNSEFLFINYDGISLSFPFKTLFRITKLKK